VELICLRNFLLFILFSFSTTLVAKESWIIEPAKSSITFTATQNDAPVSGEFKTFTGTIDFDPNDLPSSNIHIIVDMASVASDAAKVADYLKMEEWFNVSLFPKADFQSKSIKKIGDITYEAEGTLMIRDKTVPVTLTFNLDKFSPALAYVTGKTTIKRKDFGVGQGEWGQTDLIKDNVEVNFIITAHEIK